MSNEQRTAYLEGERIGTAQRRMLEELLECDRQSGDAFDESQMANLTESPQCSEDLLGRVLDGFRIESELGRGGSAIVYRARQISLNRTVAIKVLTFPILTDILRERFRREALAGARLHHEHVVRVYQFGQHDGLYFYAMEMIEGQSLAEWLCGEGGETPTSLHSPALRQHLAYSFDNIAKWTAQAARALGHAHCHGVVHRDIKPANLLLTTSGQIKILDFGVAKLLGESTLSIAGGVVGTPRYMSPEQCSLDAANVDHRTDIYSLGTVLYQLLTGKPPFAGTDFGALINGICNSEPLKPRLESAEIPLALELICLRATAKQPQDRYQNADDMAEDLDAYLAGRPISVKPRPIAARYFQHVREHFAPHRWTVPFAVVVVTLLIAASFGPRPNRLQLFDQRQITSDTGLTTDPSFSRNGRWLAYASDRDSGGDMDLWLQALGPNREIVGDAIRVMDSESDETEPAISPDGRLLAFTRSGTDSGVYLVNLTPDGKGIQQRLVSTRGRRPRFSPDGERLAFWRGSRSRSLAEVGHSLWVVAVRGDEPQRLCADFGRISHPVWSPNGKQILFRGRPCDGKDRMVRWWVADLRGGAPRPVDIDPLLRAEGISWPSLCVPSCWTPEGTVIFSAYINDGLKLWSLELSPVTLRTGTLQQLTVGGTQELYAEVAGDGRCCFAALEYDYGIWKLPFDADGGVTTGQLSCVAAAPSSEMTPAVSLDGKRIVYQSDRRGSYDIFLKRHEEAAERIVDGPENQGNCVISANGRTIAYLQMAENSFSNPDSIGLWVKQLDGMGEARLVGHNLGQPLDWHPSDGARYLLANQAGRLLLVDTTNGESRTIVEHPEWQVHMARFSGDGRWLVFAARRRDGKLGKQIFVSRFSILNGSHPDWHALTDGKDESYVPDWSPNGHRVYYLSDRGGRVSVWSQAVDTAKHAEGLPQEVYRFEQFRLSPINVGAQLVPFAVSQNQLVFCLSNAKSNLFVAHLEGR